MEDGKNRAEFAAAATVAGPAVVKIPGWVPSLLYQPGEHLPKPSSDSTLFLGCPRDR